jgi:hypothetical protein
LREGRFQRWQPCPLEQPEVYVDGIVRPKDGQWIVTLFLVDGQEERNREKDSAWLFQCELMVEGSNRAPVFLRRPHWLDYSRIDCGDEMQTMDMLHRHLSEYAVGHGVGVHWELANGNPNRAVQIRTRAVPEWEVPKVTPPTAEDDPLLKDLLLDMKELADTPQEEFGKRLKPLLVAYGAWIEKQEKRLGNSKENLGDFQNVAKDSLERCRATLYRIQEGIELLGRDPLAAQAFQFLNQAMHLQRIHTLYAEKVRREETPRLEEVDIPQNRTWYPFQLAFILINLSSVANPLHPDRTGKEKALADLLWFPTGGGKTEAYLGLTAFTLGMRRLQRDRNLGGMDSENGVAVLMRYTLRLLTLQQFQRATALICACETIRREEVEDGVPVWGETPFRIGLWVGSRATPNRTDQSAEAVLRDHGQRGAAGMGAGGGSPHQLMFCPWCGAEIKPGRDIQVEKAPGGAGRTFIYCGDPNGNCPFSRRQSPQEGLPILVVDEEIYRRLPSLLIATVDKFAQMPWQGAVQTLFGRVNGYCERHGYRAPEIEDSDSHVAAGAYPRATTSPRHPVRPPDLIIQDELHLISGPLGSLVGLYETAVDYLCTWNLEDKAVHPKVVASTATIRRAQDQVHQIFVRKVSVFPPNGLDMGDSFFALQRECSEDHPGRLYIGICAPGKRQKAALIRVYVALLSAAQHLYKKYGDPVDPWMTLVGYFNSLRELGGMRRLTLDDVRSRLRDMEKRGLAARNISESTVEELTSRKSSTDIPRLLDRLEMVFSPAAEAKWKEARAKGEARKSGPIPLDVIRATNRVSVGVDVKRLGLMVVGGQPKTTAEYIQATSRVGRSNPGLVVTVFNWARPRDLSHYEQFEHYHSTFYKHVEALSVTPYSCGAIDRGLSAVFVACVRLAEMDMNENGSASNIDPQDPLVQKALEVIVNRAHLVACKGDAPSLTRQTLADRLDEWVSLARQQGTGRILGYKDKRDGRTIGLLQMAGTNRWGPFTCLNSLRDVEPSVGLILDDRELD